VKPDDLESTIDRYANPNLVKFAEVLLEKVSNGDFIAGVVGQNIVLEGLAFSVFEMLEAGSREFNPKFAHTLSGTIADERRHVGFGENRIGSLIQQHPEKKAEIEQMQQEMTYYMLAVFADSFRGPQNAPKSTPTPTASAEWHGTNLSTASPEEMEEVLATTVLGEFKTRLARVGLEYRTPRVPA
jgi:hypothetical protein